MFSVMARRCLLLYAQFTGMNLRPKVGLFLKISIGFGVGFGDGITLGSPVIVHHWPNGRRNLHFCATALAMKILSPAISRLARLRCQRIHAWMANPFAAQTEVLNDLLTHGQYTRFGQKHGLSNVFTADAFRKAVPIHEYDELKPWIEQILAGEENVLWNTPVEWMAKSSGTTSDKSKYIPITQESLEDNHFTAARDVLSLYYDQRPESDLLTGKGLVIGGSHQVSALNDEIQTGDLSAVLLQNAPLWGNWVRTPELSIALLDDWETKIEALAQSTIQENVTSISGVPTWTLVLLKRILEITGARMITEVWPQLEVYIHGGVAFEPYKDQFAKLLGPNVQYVEIYNASEAFVAAQDEIGGEGLLLMLNHGIFYEFLPVENYGDPWAETCLLHEVELGKKYALVISTNGGLWRYLLGDTVVFTSLEPYRIKVAGRVKHFINAFGEELMVHNADEAIKAACAATGLSVNDYTAAPIYFSDAGNGGHEWLIEFEDAPDAAALQHFGQVMDDALKAANSDYEAKRAKDIALRFPVLRVLPKGRFHQWLKSKGKLGGQHKVPRLSNDRAVVEEVKQLPDA